MYLKVLKNEKVGKTNILEMEEFYIILNYIQK